MNETKRWSMDKQKAKIRRMKKMNNEKESWMNKKKNDKNKRRISGNGQEIKNKARSHRMKMKVSEWIVGKVKKMRELKKWEENIQTANKNQNCEMENRNQK